MREGDDGHAPRLDRGSCREARALAPQGPLRSQRFARGVSLGVVTCWFAACAATWPARRDTRAQAIPVEDVVLAGRPVEHASLLAGGAGVCAQTRRRDGQHQVICRPVGARAEWGVARGAPLAWSTDELVRLTLASGYPRSDGSDSTPSSARAVVATGALRDGRVVAFRAGDDQARPLELPSTDAHGAIIELRQVTWRGVSRMDDEASPWNPEWVALTADGALLAVEAQPQARWTVLLPPSRHVSSFALVAGFYCALSGDREVVCGGLTRPDLPDGPGPTADDALAQDGQVEIALSLRLACTRSREGHVRCARVGDRFRERRLVSLHGPTRPIVAMALGDHDLCLREVDGAWWCASGPEVDEPGRLLDVESLTLHPAPPLANALEVAFSDGAGCARTPDGGVGCWGDDPYGAPGTRRALQIAGIESATSVEVGEFLACAVDQGRVRCWENPGHFGAGERPPGGAARLVEVRLPAAARLVSPGHPISCAVGLNEVWCWRNSAGASASPRALGLRRAGARGAIRSVLLLESDVWLTTDRGEVWRWRDADGRAPGVRRVRSLEGGHALLPVPGGVVCAMRDDTVVRCDLDGLPPLSQLSPGRVLPLVSRRWISTPRELGEIGASYAPRPCVVGSTGRVACLAASGHEYKLVDGVDDARSASGTRRYGCALRNNGRVFCWGVNPGWSPAASETDGAPRLVPFAR